MTLRTASEEAREAAWLTFDPVQLDGQSGTYYPIIPGAISDSKPALRQRTVPPVQIDAGSRSRADATRHVGADSLADVANRGAELSPGLILRGASGAQWPRSQEAPKRSPPAQKRTNLLRQV